MLIDEIEVWVEGLHEGFAACGFSHTVWVEPTNGKWEPGESFRIFFSPEEGTCRDEEERKSILYGIVSNFRRVFDGKVGEYPSEYYEETLSAVVEDVRGR